MQFVQLLLHNTPHSSRSPHSKQWGLLVPLQQLGRLVVLQWSLLQQARKAHPVSSAPVVPFAAVPLVVRQLVPS